jgi:ribose-phosphate pyrophosphokinase
MKALLDAGARPEFILAATHGLFRASAREKLDDPSVREVFVTDTVPVAEEHWEKLHVVSIAPAIAETLGSLLTGNSTDVASTTDKPPSKFRWRWGERVT